MPRLCSSLLLSLVIASSASGITMAWTPIGNPGNAADDTGYGAVSYAYSIATYEVTNAQYVEFLNAKAASDPLGLYNTQMASGFGGGITRDGLSGSYTYSAIAVRADRPVNYVSFYDALRFANWMNNGQGSGDTEMGAYTLLGGTATPINGGIVTRNPLATIFLTSENEWYKAAYYSALTTSYFEFPAGSDAQTTCAPASGGANTANCNSAVGDLTIRGSYTGSASPYGTFDQGGNVWEWDEAIISSSSGPCRGIRGGSFGNIALFLSASVLPGCDDPSRESSTAGFRLVLIPEPGTGLLVIAGLLRLTARRRGRA